MWGALNAGCKLSSQVHPYYSIDREICQQLIGDILDFAIDARIT